jgi:hypothetical protein
MEPDSSPDLEFLAQVRRAHRLVYALIAGWALLLAAIALWPALSQGGSWSSRYDWRYFETMTELARRTVLWYREVPLWNPYSCGGEVGLANPQSLDGAPTFLLVLLFGTAWGLKLGMLLYLALGIFGTALLARRLDLGWTGSVVAGTSYGLSGYMALHLSSGHINFAGVSLYPLLLYCFVRTVADRRWLVGAAAVAGWIASLGGTFTPAMAGEVLVLWVTAMAVRPLRNELPARTRLRDTVSLYGLLLAVALGALLLFAFRMLPTLEFILDHPRPLFRRTPDLTQLKQVLFDLFAWRDFGPLPQPQVLVARVHRADAQPDLAAGGGADWAWLLGEGRLFRSGATLTGRLVGALGGVGAAVAGELFAAFAMVAAPEAAGAARSAGAVPSLGAGGAVAVAAGRAGRRLGDVVAGAAHAEPLAAVAAWGGAGLLGTAVDATVFFSHSFAGVFTVRLVLPESPVPFFHVQGHWSQMRELELLGQGVMGCDEEAPLQRAEKLALGDVPQAWLVDPAHGADPVVSAHSESARASGGREAAGGARPPQLELE